MAIDLVLGLADRSYEQGDWASAITFYRNALAIEPHASAACGCRLTIAHCQIELAAPDELAALVLETDASSGTARERVIASRLRVRARDLCRAGDFARATRVLRLLTTCDAAIAEVYARAIDAPPGAAGAGDDTRDPPFLADLAGLDVDAVKRRTRGLRVMLGFRRIYYGMPERQYEPPDLFARSAERFGLTVGAVDVSPLERDPAALATGLYEHINAFRPDLIVLEGLFRSGATASDPTVALHVATVLGVVRRRLGAKVVNSVPDAWRWSDAQLFQGLGSAVDLLHHWHPAIRARAAPVERAATFCYVPPLDLPAPTADPGTIAAACFVGTIAEASIARLAWWAEAGARGLPLVFLETDAATPAERADAAFADLHRAHQLSVNFTRRATGVVVLTARTIQSLLAGGVLLEEQSRDSAHFLAPGVHYVPFATLADLATTIERLLPAPELRARLADAGQGWARRYFTGDYFWAGLLQRVLAAGR
jgi:hypothetical protein